MGQFEKIVVLLSFLLVTVILVISFSSDDEKPPSMGTVDEVAAADLGGSPGEVSGSGAALGREEGSADSGASFGKGTASAGAAEGSAPPSDPQQHSLQALRDREVAEEVEAPDLLLDTSGTKHPTPAQPETRVPAGAALITLEGLTDTFEAEIKEYTWLRNDTFVSVARKLYGDVERARLLRQFNEDVSYKAPGEKILVPVFDRRSAADRAAPDSSGAPPSIAAGTLYEVVDGDSLWVISKKVYGKGVLWEKIFEANQDQLSGPDDLSVGQKLRIP